MDSQKLHHFLNLAKTLHFNRAAELSHVSPSTLSRSIQQLEKELGAPMFVRDNRSVSLTHQGGRLLDFASNTLRNWDALKDELIAESSLLRGSLTIYCSVTASYSFLYDILADFRQDQPLIEITLHTGDPALSVDRIVADNEDVAIAARKSPMPHTVEFKKITDSPLTLIRPKASNLSVLDCDEDHIKWSNVPFILAERGVTRERLDSWFRRNNIKPNIYAQVAGHEAIVSLVSLGFGVGLVPKIVLDNSPLANRVEPFAKQDGFGQYEVGLCVLQKRLKNPIVRAFWEKIGH